MEQENFLVIDTESGKATPVKLEPFPIYNDKHPLMRMVMPPVDAVLPDRRVSEVAERLILTRKAVKGAGIAANQCGVAMRMFVIGSEDFDMVCINPEILEETAPPIAYREGCLSYPGLFLKIKRPDGIRVRYTDMNGEVIEETINGLTARCFQHEMDHLNGITMTDHVGKTAMYMAEKKRKKVMKSIERRGYVRG